MKLFLKSLALIVCSCVIGFGARSSSASSSGDSDCAPGVRPAPGVVVTTTGAVRGVPQGASYEFLGIPYAAPPVGELRFRPPQEHACFNGEYEAKRFGQRCPQLDGDNNAVGGEDCLTLNIWIPATPARVPLPVMFFIHGGGNLQGASSNQLADGTYIYDGQHLSEKAEAVVVTINYRLGILGFLTLPQLGTEDEHGVSGNYGLLDQIAALKWVQSNIAAFGGDPSKTMIFGQSAGGLNVCELLTSPLAAGLFSSAVIESATCGQQTTERAETIGADVVVAAGCQDAADVVACLREKTAPDLVVSRPGNTNLGLKSGDYQPQIDGYVLPATPLYQFRKGHYNHVPLIIGANAYETDQMVPRSITTEAQYHQFIRGLYPVLADVIFPLYPVSDYPSPRDAAVAVTTDARFICPSRFLARTVAANQTEPVFRYFFTHTVKLGGGSTVRAIHGQELLFVFEHLAIGGYAPTVAEKSLADIMVSYWSHLAAAGNPNAGGAPWWPQHFANRDVHLVLDTPIWIGGRFRAAQCDLWDALLTRR
jgi:para-nitrobenzyl esterase